MMDTNITQDTIILINGEGMGRADPPLQHQLLKTYLQLVGEIEPLPAALCFYADGVKMALDGSPVLDELRALEERGVYIILCGTCLSYFDVVDDVAVGVQGGMTDIIEAQWQATKVITL